MLNTETQPAQNQEGDSVPLCVDLDRTLVASDTFMESLVALVKAAPLDLLQLPWWCLQGLPEFKRRVADRIEVDPAKLPYRPTILEFLQTEKGHGRRLVLATASDHQVARGVADHVGLFDDVIATNGIAGNSTNLRRSAKLEAIRHLIGDQPFDYVGDSSDDLAVWAGARQAYLVDPAPKVLEQARRIGNVEKVFDQRPAGSTAAAAVRAIRPQQWIKNLLLAVPMFLGQQLGDLGAWFALAVAIVAFSLCASSVYVVNDLLDVPADREHPIKRRRPFAASLLKVETGLVMAVLLALTGLLLAVMLPGAFLGALVAYVMAASAYSFWAKGRVVIDVLLLAGLYTLRIVAGGAATATLASPWLLALSLFLFLSIAFAKRYAELTLVEASRGHKAHGRGYVVQDLSLIGNLGPTSGYLAVLVFALYINLSDQVKGFYERPLLLWLICPLLLYWITRIWFKAHRRELGDDPLLFALTDRTTYLVSLLVVVIAFFANQSIL